MPKSGDQALEIKHYQDRIEDLEIALETALYWYHKPEGELNSDAMQEIRIVTQILGNSRFLSQAGK